VGRVAGLVLAAASLASFHVSPALAAEGYSLDASEPFHGLEGIPRGLTVDQANQDLYVAIFSINPLLGIPGQIDRFGSDLTTHEAFVEGGGYYTGVVGNPLTHDFYGLQVEIRTTFGNFGTSRIDRFSPAGVAAGSFAVAYPHALPPIATDSTGRIFYPNNEAHSVQVFSAAGVLLEEITCGGCPGGALGVPVSVALDASDNLYVADLKPDRALKLTPSGGGGSYVYATTLQGGQRAAAVAVDPASGDVFVGDLPGEHDYHIVAYNSAGTEFDDFGLGLFPDPILDLGAAGAYQIAVNGTTHELFVGHIDKFVVFERTAIDPPSVATEVTTDVTQIGATLHASINPNGHAVLECKLEYVDDDEFQLNGFTNATSSSCPELHDDYTIAAISQAVSGLAPGTTYHLRAAATTHAGSQISSPDTFETLPPVAPTVVTQTPEDIGGANATLRGSVDPRGGGVSDCHFDFGTSESYGTSVPCAALPGPVVGDVAVGASVSGLPHDTVHHYRLVVTSNAGTGSGDDVAFSTLGLPPPEPAPAPGPGEEPAAAPPPATPPAMSRPLPRCRKGFRRRRVKGRLRCVKICRRGLRRKRAGRRTICVRRGHARSHRHHRRRGGR